MMNIMVADHSHLESLVEIMASTFHLACPDSSSRDLQALYISKHLNIEYFEQILGSEEYRVWVAIVDQNVVGLAVLEHNSEESAILSKLYVLPAFQGQGIALKLYASLLNHTQKSGYSRLQLFVYSGNNRAKIFYKKQGFKLIGTDEYSMESERHKDEVYELFIS